MGWAAEMIRACSGDFQTAQHQRLVRVVCIKRKGVLGLLLKPFMRIDAEKETEKTTKKRNVGFRTHIAYIIIYT